MLLGIFFMNESIIAVQLKVLEKVEEYCLDQFYMCEWYWMVMGFEIDIKDEN